MGYDNWLDLRRGTRSCIAIEALLVVRGIRQAQNFGGNELWLVATIGEEALAGRRCRALVKASGTWAFRFEALFRVKKIDEQDQGQEN